MDFSVLGPLHVSRDAEPVYLGGPGKPRLLLAILLAHPGRAVPIDTLVGGLWTARPPASARRNLHQYVHRLRGFLQPQRITARDGGYELTPQPADTIDSALFRELARQGSDSFAAGDLPAASATLERGLRMWRGPAFSGFCDCAPIAGEAARLDRLRLAAREQWAEAGLRLGRHSMLVPPLREFCDEHPFNENLAGLLMTALAGCGRRAEAMQVFHGLRRALVDELGVEPSDELQRVHHSILQGVSHRRTQEEPPPAPAGAGPSQLPPAPADFTGRRAELAQLDELDRTGAEQGRARVVVVCGTAGVGKTALALAWGRHAGRRFPQGRLYVNLRGFDASKPLRPMEALVRLLPALGVPVEQVPSDLESAAALYRGLLDGGRVLVVLDNARDAEQVRPLLPAAPGCVAVVTSRDRLSGLVARDGAKRVALGPLGDAEALALLAEIIGSSRLDGEPKAARALVKACANLPLALRVAAASLADHPARSIDGYLQQLAAGESWADDDLHGGLRAALDLSYDTLEPDEAAMLRLLGLVPGPDFTAGACAALAGTSRARAERRLERLAAAHLVQEHADGRYTFHDLLRAYAIDKLTGHDDAQARAAAEKRLFDWYLRRAHEAARFLYPQPPRTPVPDVPGAEAPPATAREALAWLDLERPNLVALIVPAPGKPSRPGAWRLAAELGGYFWRQAATTEWERVAQEALASAIADGDPRGEGNARLNLRRILAKQGRMREISGIEVDPVERLARAIGWPQGEIFALNSVGAARIETGRLASAAKMLHRARSLLEADGAEKRTPIFLINLARVYHRWGEPAIATAYARQVLDYYTAHGARGEIAVGHLILSMVDRDKGDAAQAEAHARTGLVLATEVGDPHGRTYQLIALAASLHDLGRADEAADIAAQALALSREVQVPQLSGYALLRLAEGDLRAGRYTEALARHVQALRIGRTTGYQSIEISARTGLALAPQLPPPQRISHARAAFAEAERTGARLFAAQVSHVLARVYLEAGRPEQALRAARLALRLCAACAHRPGETQARAILHALR